METHCSFERMCFSFKTLLLYREMTVRGGQLASIISVLFSRGDCNEKDTRLLANIGTAIF